MATQYANGKIVTDGLVLAFDAADRNSYPGSGTTWRDLATNKTATIVGGTYSSLNGGALSVNGYNNSNRINVNTPDSISLSNCTIQLFIQVDSFSNYAGVAAFGYGTSNLSNSVSINSGNGFNQIRMTSDGGANTIITTVTAYNTWQFFSGVRDATNTTMSISRNGGARTTTSGGTYNTFTADTAWMLSNSPNATQQWAGFLAVVLFYNRALSVAEELQNYNVLRQRFGL